MLDQLTYLPAVRQITVDGDTSTNDTATGTAHARCCLLRLVSASFCCLGSGALPAVYISVERRRTLAKGLRQSAGLPPTPKLTRLPLVLWTQSDPGLDLAPPFLVENFPADSKVLNYSPAYEDKPYQA